MPLDVRIGLETFADEVTVLVSPTTDRALLAAQIETIVVGGDTALYDVVVGAVTHFTPTVENKVLVVLSDGKDEGSSATLTDAIAAAQGISIETISLTTAETDLASLTALGPVTSADDPAAVSSAFARVAGLLVEVIETVPTSTAPATTVAPTTVPPPATTVAAAAPPTTMPLGMSAPEASTSSAWLIVGAIGLFGGLFLLTLLLFPGERVSKARLGIDKPRSMSDIGTRSVSAIEEALERYGKRADLGNALGGSRHLDEAGRVRRHGRRGRGRRGLVGLVLAGPIVGVLVAIAVCVAVRFYVRRAEAKRQAAFADQLPDVLQLVTTALRSGFGLTQALGVGRRGRRRARSQRVRPRARRGPVGSRSVGLDDGARPSDGQQRPRVGGVGDRHQPRHRWQPLGDPRPRECHDPRARTDRPTGPHAHRRRTAVGAHPHRHAASDARMAMAGEPDNFELLTYGVGLVALVIAGILMILGAHLGPPDRQLGRSLIEGVNMELALILGSFALVAAFGMLWWGITSRPSAARGNLFAGLPDPAPEPSP
jgi:hypothetical protein